MSLLLIALLPARGLGAAPAILGQSAFNLEPGRITVLLVILAMAALLFYYFDRIRKRPDSLFVRRIAGIDAIEEAIGRCTEMGRPLLYVPGIEDMQDIQTIASMLILGKVAETSARYKSQIYVPCRVPFVMSVAEEMVRQGFYNAGLPED